MGEERSGILLMISMGDREWYVATRGEAIRVFTDYGLEILEEQIVPYLSEGEYERAFETFGDLCENFLKEAKENRPYDRDHPYRRPMPLWLRGVICLVSGLAVGGGILAVLTAQLRSVGYEKRAQEYVRDNRYTYRPEPETFFCTGPLPAGESREVIRAAGEAARTGLPTAAGQGAEEDPFKRKKQPEVNYPPAVLLRCRFGAFWPFHHFQDIRRKK